MGDYNMIKSWDGGVIRNDCLNKSTWNLSVFPSLLNIILFCLTHGFFFFEMKVSVAFPLRVHFLLTLEFHHPITPVLWESSFQLEEVTSWVYFLKAQAQVSEWKFLRPGELLTLRARSLKSNGDQKHLFGGQSQKPFSPHTFSLADETENMLLAKFSFYFHGAEPTSISLKWALTAKSSPWPLWKDFQLHQADAANVSLIFDNRGSESFQGPTAIYPIPTERLPRSGSISCCGVFAQWLACALAQCHHVCGPRPTWTAWRKWSTSMMTKFSLPTSSTRPEPHFCIVVIFESKEIGESSHFLSLVRSLCP